MDCETLSLILDFVNKFKGLNVDCFNELKSMFPDCSADTLYSIMSLEYQKRMKMKHSKTEVTKNKYWNLYQRALKVNDGPGIILRISKKVEVTPCLVAKLILQKHFEKSPVKNKEGRPPNYNLLMRNTTLIDDMDLSYEIFLCTLHDILYSPTAGTMKHTLGQQYEIQLHNQVVKMGLCFRDEQYLRQHGYDKTPDIKLEVPISVDGFIINWIESKALFGQAYVHKEYMKNQYLPYWNRFGTGLVIYWFGFDENIVEPTEMRILIQSSMPENFVTLSEPGKFSLTKE